MQELILEEKTTLSPVMKEIYRRLRTNLEFTGIENKVICLTSCMENAEFIDHPDVDEILGTEAAAYEFIEKKMSAK